MPIVEKLNDYWGNNYWGVRIGKKKKKKNVR